MLFDKFKFQKIIFHLFLFISLQFSSGIHNFQKNCIAIKSYDFYYHNTIKKHEKLLFRLNIWKYFD